MSELFQQSRFDPVRLLASVTAVSDGVQRRVRLLFAPQPEGAHRPSLKLLGGEIAYVARALAGRAFTPCTLPRCNDPKVVILLPGFGADARRMGRMARELERAGHKVKRWKLGLNLGPSEEQFARLSERIVEVHERYGKPVCLVGWSLGGVYAREMAKLHPDRVSKVITMGSPFSHTPWSNNMWRTYQAVTGYPVNDPPIACDVRAKPPVETVALWSARDAVVSPRAARGMPGERDRAIAIRCTHLGFADSNESILAVGRELA
ncbi:alpha/beta fold hydrolase [Aurantiacibacter suaedae]|uniref:alpha/beta hydrolase family protein n=1 Tax=Aurantiacibacter suaedae TaxID=2545755 RepID=UPI0010F8A26A|nr:alpha/beta fold hydrolase [Aurantiacibacter suaedae]